MENKDQLKSEEVAEQAEGFKDYLLGEFDERQLRLIQNCHSYANNDPAGLPGHNLLLIVSRLALECGIDSLVIDHALGKATTEDIVRDWWEIDNDSL